MPDSEMTDTTNEDKEIERIARIAMINNLLARDMHAEAERDRLKEALLMWLDADDAGDGQDCINAIAHARRVVGIEAT
jgi:hypothetical protein